MGGARARRGGQRTEGTGTGPELDPRGGIWVIRPLRGDDELERAKVEGIEKIRCSEREGGEGWSMCQEEKAASALASCRARCQPPWTEGSCSTERTRPSDALSRLRGLDTDAGPRGREKVAREGGRGRKEANGGQREGRDTGARETIVNACLLRPAGLGQTPPHPSLLLWSGSSRLHMYCRHQRALRVIAVPLTRQAYVAMQSSRRRAQPAVARLVSLRSVGKRLGWLAKERASDASGAERTE